MKSQISAWRPAACFECFDLRMNKCSRTCPTGSSNGGIDRCAVESASSRRRIARAVAHLCGPVTSRTFL